MILRDIDVFYINLQEKIRGGAFEASVKILFFIHKLLLGDEE